MEDHNKESEKLQGAKISYNLFQTFFSVCRGRGHYAFLTASLAHLGCCSHLIHFCSLFLVMFSILDDVGEEGAERPLSCFSSSVSGRSQLSREAVSEMWSFSEEEGHRHYDWQTSRASFT